MLKKIRDLLGRRGQKSSTSAGLSRPPIHQGPQVVHRPIPETDLDPDAVKIVQRLTRFDHKAYLVGGCVRDLLLERNPKDFDIGTSATPRQVRRCFRNCRIIGRRFRLAHIYFQNGKIIEVATFRAQGEASAAETNGKDGDLLIREDNLFGTPESDALRRDFTVNSLFYDLNDGNVIDHAGGLDDLRRKLVRTIGDPEVRFPEDPIRILRAIKFAARLGFTIEPGTLRALEASRDEIPKAAPPRILEEISRFGREGAARRSFELLRETGVFEVILPELARDYRNDRAWELLLAIAEGMDRRRAGGQEVAAGEVFAAMLLPAVVDRLGWTADGKVVPPKKLDVRSVADNRLRPIALRLRVSRRDQERCRQIIGILSRMVPLSAVRPATRRGLLRRVAFGEAQWMLAAVAEVLGGDFAEAAEAWLAQAPARPAESDREEDSEERPRRRRRRRRGGRGRRGGRHRSAGDDDTSRDEPAASEGGGQARSGGGQPRGGGRRKSAGGDSPGARGERKPAGGGRPAKWDDDYFFAALPNAPDMAGDDGGRDRYGAGNVASVATDDDPETGTETARDDGPAPRRRRRRRRRRGSGSRGGSGSSGSGSAGGDES